MTPDHLALVLLSLVALAEAAALLRLLTGRTAEEAEAPLTPAAAPVWPWPTWGEQADLARWQADAAAERALVDATPAPTGDEVVRVVREACRYFDLPEGVVDLSRHPAELGKILSHVACELDQPNQFTVEDVAGFLRNRMTPKEPA